jgi:uncharacterized protein (TIGR00290 family)
MSTDRPMSADAPARTWLSWSSGKDSAMALGALRVDDGVEVVGLLTTINAAAQRVAMHAVRRALLESQAAAVGLPLHVVELPWPCPNEAYEAAMRAALDGAVAEGVEAVAFGDLFLEDVRAYREAALAGTPLTPLFPLWGRPTDELAREIVDVGVSAVLTCVDPAQAPASLAGRRFDHALLASLPPGVDPCGERGEFHTFVSWAPGFSHEIEVEVGQVMERDGFVFADVVPR